MKKPGYRRLVGLLLLWAIAPMPVLYVILPPFWILAAVVALLLVFRPDRAPRVPNWLQNVLAVVIVVTVAMVGGWRVGPIRPLGHLLLLLTSVRVLSVTGRKTFLRAIQAVFLVWVVSVASSTHVTLAPYLLASVVVWWWAGMRIHLLGLGFDGQQAPEVNVSWRHVAAAALVVLMIAVPIFVFLPRLNSPWVAGQSSRRTSGFSTRVELARTGNIEESRELAVVVTAPEGTEVHESWTRLRGTGFNMVFAGSWVPARNTTAADRVGDLVWLRENDRDLEETVELSFEVVRPAGYLFVPTSAVAVRTSYRVRKDTTGGLVLRDRVDGALHYTVLARRVEVADRTPPEARDLYLPKGNGEVLNLAERLTEGVSDARNRASLIEDHLQQNYTYSLDVRPDSRVDPVAWFLLRGREGHCEFFAGAMVVLLRHLEVPARLVGGYSGGALNPAGNQVVVREANAHTWVEVWLGEDEGWVTFDPTPGEGVPALEGQSGLERLRWAWERVQDSWDRYVLTFGLGEQVGLVNAAGELVAWTGTALVEHRGRIIGGVGLASGLLVFFLFERRRHRRQHRPATAVVVDRLERRLGRSGVEVPAGATVRWIGGAAREQWPRASGALSELVRLAEGELYAVGPKPVERVEAWRLWRRIHAGMSKQS